MRHVYDRSHPSWERLLIRLACPSRSSWLFLPVPRSSSQPVCAASPLGWWSLRRCWWQLLSTSIVTTIYLRLVQLLSNLQSENSHRNCHTLTRKRFAAHQQIPEDSLFHCRIVYEDSIYAPLRGRQELEENVGIYLDDNYEQISVPVPHFGGSDPADIIHDFQRVGSRPCLRMMQSRLQNLF